MAGIEWAIVFDSISRRYIGVYRRSERRIVSSYLNFKQNFTKFNVKQVMFCLKPKAVNNARIYVANSYKL